MGQVNPREMSSLEQLRRGTLNSFRRTEIVPLPDLGRSPERTGAQARTATSFPARDSAPARSFPYLPAAAAAAAAPRHLLRSAGPGGHGRVSPGNRSTKYPTFASPAWPAGARRAQRPPVGRVRVKATEVPDRSGRAAPIQGLPIHTGPRSTRAARKSAKGTRSLQDSDS